MKGFRQVLLLLPVVSLSAPAFDYLPPKAAALYCPADDTFCVENALDGICDLECSFPRCSAQMDLGDCTNRNADLTQRLLLPISITPLEFFQFSSRLIVRLWQFFRCSVQYSRDEADILLWRWSNVSGRGERIGFEIPDKDINELEGFVLVQVSFEGEIDGEFYEDYARKAVKEIEEFASKVRGTQYPRCPNKTSEKERGSDVLWSPGDAWIVP